MRGTAVRTDERRHIPEVLSGRPGRRAGWRGELLLIFMPTVAVLVALRLVQEFTRHQLLFTSLASSAFLIYLDPNNPANKVRTLIVAQMSAASLGLIAFEALGAGYAAAAVGMVGAITMMIAFDAFHPPAASTALSFALRSEDATDLATFALAVAVTAALVLLELAAVAILSRATKGPEPTER